MKIYTKQIDFNTIKEPWDNHLWTHRENTPYSSMLMRGGHDPQIKEKYKWRAFGAYMGNSLLGVNAGHKSGNRDYRTRGLWVSQRSRGTGVAQLLFSVMENQAKNECCRWLWSYPRLAALPAYQKAGYVSYGEPDLGEFDHCVKARKDLSSITTSIYQNINSENPMMDAFWIDSMDKLEDKEILLGQNYEIRGEFVHITQHWVNDLYETIEKKPLTLIRGDLNNKDHVL